MAMEQHWNTERNIERAQQNSMSLSEVGEGYDKQVAAAFTGKSAPAVRNEIQQFLKLRPVLSMTGQEQYENLQALVKALSPFKSIFDDVSNNHDEYTAFALALVHREKSLQ